MFQIKKVEAKVTKKKYFDENVYMRALQRGETEKSARAIAQSERQGQFNFIQRFKSWRYKTKQNKLEKIWSKQLERDKQNKK